MSEVLALLYLILTLALPRPFLSWASSNRNRKKTGEESLALSIQGVPPSSSSETLEVKAKMRLEGGYEGSGLSLHSNFKILRRKQPRHAGSFGCACPPGLSIHPWVSGPSVHSGAVADGINQASAQAAVPTPNSPLRSLSPQSWAPLTPQGRSEMLLFLATPCLSSLLLKISVEVEEQGKPGERESHSLRCSEVEIPSLSCTKT